jgi:hypothetical protein
MAHSNAPAAVLVRAPAVMVRGEAFRELGRWHGMRSAQAWATRLGLTLSTVTRNINGETAASGAFIAGVLTIFPDVAFERLFYIGTPSGAPSAASGDLADADDADEALAV